jgi:hypothetical protein
VFALALFAIGIPFIQYGVEVKQYIFDATAAILLVYLALTLRDPETTTRRLVLAGLSAFVIIWFSQASVVVMGGIGAALALILPSLSREDLSLDLYDLSDTVRLRSADAESFPVAPMPKDPRPGCRPWAKPSPLDSLR